jgi:hypothetical protein
VLHLHPPALAGQVGLVVALGEHTILAEALLVVEPRLRNGRVAGPGGDERDGSLGHRGEVAGGFGPAQLARERAELSAAFRQLPAGELVGPTSEQVEDDERRRDLAGELAHPRLRRMQPELQLVEVHRPVGDADDLPIGHERSVTAGFEPSDQLWEVAPERPPVTARKPSRAALVDRHDRAEAVPLGFVGPPLTRGHLRLQLREHRRGKVARDRSLRHEGDPTGPP